MANAIIMASGLGTRMRPLTETTPKPLIKVCGRPMIETVIGALCAHGIENIFVVAGYLQEQFGYLPQKYKNVRIIENPDYREVNNISSVYYACDVLKKGDCYICEADLYLANPDIFGVVPESSCYFGKFVTGKSDDWVFDLGADGFITRVGKGGADCYNMVGISYFTAADAKTLAEAISSAYGKQGYETLFWDDAVNANLGLLKLKIKPVAEHDIVEIDTVEELNAVNAEFKE